MVRIKRRKKKLTSPSIINRGHPGPVGSQSSPPHALLPSVGRSVQHPQQRLGQPQEIRERVEAKVYQLPSELDDLERELVLLRVGEAPDARDDVAEVVLDERDDGGKVPLDVLSRPALVGRLRRVVAVVPPAQAQEEKKNQLVRITTNCTKDPSLSLHFKPKEQKRTQALKRV